MEKCDLKIMGVANVGPKGQIVIPKEVRELLQISSGDSFVVLLKDNKYIGLVRNQDAEELMKYISSQGNLSC